MGTPSTSKRARLVTRARMDRMTEAEAVSLRAALRQAPGITVDLGQGVITAEGCAAGFALDPVWRMKLLNGWDDLDLTASYAAAIAEFHARDRLARPWVIPTGPTGE